MSLHVQRIAHLHTTLYCLHLKQGNAYLWHIISIHKTKAILLDNFPRLKDIDVKELGEVLASGWGIRVPEDILRQYRI